MKYIKTYEKNHTENWRDNEGRQRGVFSSYLYPVSLRDLPKYCDHLKKVKVDFTLYENGVKFLKAKNMPFPVLDFLLYFEDSDDKVDNLIKLWSLKFKNRAQISKWVGAKIKDVDLYLDANKYNL